MPAYRPISARFREKVRQKDGCWEWTGSRNRKGYGTIKGEGVNKPVLAHRVAWELFRGPIPAGLSVLHRCDNPQCTNPRHLFLGTIKDNNADMRSKGRASGGRTGGRRKLRPEQVLQIRAEYGPQDGKRVAADFGISYAHAWRLLKGEGWVQCAP